MCSLLMRLQPAEVWFGSATAAPQLNIIAAIRAMAPSNGNRVRIILPVPAMDYAGCESFFC
jgi:hypothetical protein